MLRSRLGECLLASFVLVTAYAVLGSYVAPRLLRAHLLGVAAAHFGRSLQLGEVRVHPFKLWVELNDLRWPDADGAPLLHVERVWLDLDGAESLWQRKLVFSELELDQPRVRVVVRRDGALNLSDFALEHGPLADLRERVPALSVENLHVNDGTLAVVERSGERPQTRSFEPLSFALRDVRAAAKGSPDTPGHGWVLSATSDAGARLEVSVQKALSPALTLAGTVALSGLPLATLGKRWTDELPIAVTRGSLQLQGSYALALGERGQLDLRLTQAVANDVSLQAHDASAIVDIAAVELSDAWLALTQRSINVGRLVVRGLSTHAVLDPSGSFNLASLYAEREGETEPGAWSARVHSFELSDAAVDVTDERVPEGAEFHLAPIAVTMQDVSLDGQRSLPLTASVRVGPNGSIQARGRITPSPFALDLDVRADDIALPSLQPYVRTHAALTIEDGQLGLAGKLRIKTRPNAQPQVSYSGELALRDLRTTDDAMQKELLSLKQLRLTEIQYTSLPASLEVGRVLLSQPYARVLLSAQQNLNVLSVLTDVRRDLDAFEQVEHATPAEAPLSLHAKLPLRIRLLSIEQMRMNFADFFSNPHFSAEIQNLNGTIRNVSSDPASSAQVLMKGELGANSPVLIEGSVQPFAYDKSSDIHMRFENIELPIFNPYSGRFAGYNISRGKLSTEIHYQLHDRALKADHAIRIDQLVWGEATRNKSSAPLPVKLATALLRDQNGVIKLDVPVEGRLDDPEFHFWQLLWQALKNVVIKAASAPFDFLASLFKGADQAKAIGFEPGSAELTADAKEALASLVNALAERPELRVDVPVAVAHEPDRRGIAQRKLRERVSRRLLRDDRGQGRAADWNRLNDDEKLALLSEVYRDLAGQAPSLPLADGPADAARAHAETQVEALERATCALIPVADDELAALGRQRAEAIEAALIQPGKLEPTRVLLSTAGKVTAQRGQVQLALALR